MIKNDLKEAKSSFSVIIAQYVDKEIRKSNDAFLARLSTETSLLHRSLEDTNIEIDKLRGQLKLIVVELDALSALQSLTNRGIN